jgi:hypothetical protein
MDRTVEVTSYQIVTLKAGNEERQPAGTKFGLVGVKVCNIDVKPGVTMSWAQWMAVTASGSSARTPSVYGSADWPGPLFDNDPAKAVAAGQCESGLIPFALVGDGGPVTQVQYYGAGGPAAWSVS